jgi:transcription elongation factor Elf1
MPNKKKRVPWFFKRQTSCPDCGFIFPHHEEVGSMTLDATNHEPVSFTCPRCASHYTWEEFWELNYDKYDRTADLSEEAALA